MTQASAFAPGHLTGFFQICDTPEDPLLKGARGAGLSITKGIRTKVTAEPANRPSSNIILNGNVTHDAIVSENVLDKMITLSGKPHRIEIKHEAQIPIGSGFGASGGGALSLALALNKALDLGLSRTESARVAHVAEIECKTGLGTVLAELSGGFGVIAKPGGPGVGETVRFRHADDLAAVCLHIGPISTKKALSNQGLRSRINELGGRYVDELHRDQTVNMFMELSRRFAEHVGLITPRLRAVLERTDAEGIPCTMAMFGETVFSLVEGERVEKLAEIFHTAAPSKEIMVTEIDERGARVL